MTHVAPPPPANLTPAQLRDVATQKATCPFVGSVVAAGLLPVHNTQASPLASIATMKALGNQNGSDLGYMLALVAEGNHTQRQTSGQPVPAGFFSLDFPISQGMHPSDSGILLGDSPRSPPFSFHPVNFKRLADKAQGGVLTREQVAEFVAENALRDNQTVRLGQIDTITLAHDLFGILEGLIPSSLSSFPGLSELIDQAYRRAAQNLTALFVKDTLLASAAEFALFFELIGKYPPGGGDNGPVLDVAEVRNMYENKKLPITWNAQPKSILGWIRHTHAIALHASNKYNR